MANSIRNYHIKPNQINSMVRQGIRCPNIIYRKLTGGFGVLHEEFPVNVP